MGAELPAARPVLALERPASFLLPAYRLAEGSSAARVRLHRPGSAEPAAELTATVSAWRPGSGIATLAASFTPAGVEPGEYELSVEVTGADQPSASLPVVVVEAAQADRVWAALDDAPSRGGEGTPAASAARKSRLSRRQAAAFVEGYRAALARLAQGDAAAARRAIAELELGVLAIDAAVSVEDLAELEAKVLAPLGEADPEAVLPVLALYRVHYGEALAARRYLLASHARQLAFGLADFVGERSTAARVEVANFLALFGADILSRTRTSSFSRWAFDRALELDPQNEATLLCLAIDAEKRNALREAIGFLKQLLSHQPAHREAQLRLAVAQKRLAELGSGREIEKLLAGLVGGEASDWIAAVAFQELARLHLDDEELDKARQVLEQGLARFPDDEKLLLLAAALARRAGAPGDADAYVARLAPAAEGAIGPRLRYGSFPEALLARADDAFAAASSKSGARLTAALAAAEKRKRR
jgi:hypothetical protein